MAIKKNYQLCFLILLLFRVMSCKKANQPNIIIFFTDDQGYADLGCYGAKDLQTPNIDNLAKEGIAFSQFYVPASVCTPSRASLLTGKYAKRVNLHEAVLFPYSENGLSPDEVTLPEMLKPLGYRTACIGKWHLGHLPQFMPTNQGFDHFYGVPYSNDMDSYFYKRNNFQSPPLPVYRDEKMVAEGVDQDSLTIMWTKDATHFITENKDKPSFLYLAHNMPHVPWHVSEAFRGTSQRGLYGDAVQELDWSMGQIIQVLKEQGLYDNTIILFTSDNGADNKHLNGGSDAPLRGGKATTWEGGMRVPGIVSWPAKIPQGVVSDMPVSTLDILPTLVSMAGGKLPKDFVSDGRNISYWLQNPEMDTLPEFEMLYYSRDGALEAFTDGVWKLHIAKQAGWSKKNGEFPVSLYKLDEDISETENVAGNNPEVVNRLQRRMEQLDVEIEKDLKMKLN